MRLEEVPLYACKRVDKQYTGVSHLSNALEERSVSRRRRETLLSSKALRGDAPSLQLTTCLLLQVPPEHRSEYVFREEAIKALCWPLSSKSVEMAALLSVEEGG
jgi:hypothetical protein